MALPELLKPIQILDDYIIEKYVKLTNWWEEKRSGNRYNLCLGMVVGSAVAIESTTKLEHILINRAVKQFTPEELNAQDFVIGIASIGLFLEDVVWTYQLRKDQKNGENLQNQRKSWAQSRMVRLPLLYATGRAMYKTVDYLVDNGLNIEFLQVSAYTALLASLVSSLYIKASKQTCSKTST